MKTKKKSKKIIVVAIILILLLFIVMTRKPKNNIPTDQQNAVLQTEEVSKRDLLKSVGTTGTIVSKKSRDLTVSLTDAEVKKVCVAEGDTVKKGQKLMVFDTSDAKENLEDAQTALENSKQRNELSEADAARNVTDAQTTRNYQISTAKDAMDNAYSDYKDAKNTYTKAKNKLEQLKETEQSAKEAYEAAMEEDDAVTTENDALKIAYNTAVANRKKQKEVTTTAKKQMETLENTYILQKKTYNQTVALQNSSVEAAKSNQQSTKLSEDTSTQEAQVRQYQKQVDNGVLYAPFEGTVTSINYEAGENYTGGAVLTLQDCSAYEIEAEIGEYDISDIEEGMSVVIKTDATGDEELKGTVTHISPVSTSSELSAANSSSMTSSATSSLGSSDVLYKVRISIDTLHDRLRLDMSANLSIIIEQHTNVLTVPYNAVQTDENGNSFVTVVKDDESTEKVNVDVVMESNYYTEVSSEKLKEGMNVAIEEETESSTPFENMPKGGGF